MPRIVLKKREGEGLRCEDPTCGRRTETLHFILRKGALVGLCGPCYGRFALRLPAQPGYTGGSPMKTKSKKEKRTSAADVLVEQFALKAVKPNEDLIKMVREATGSKKFDDKQLAWYKSQYRAGKLKGMNGKAGHLIAQGKLTKEAHTRRPKGSSSKAKVVVKKKAAKKEAEPVE